LENRKLFVEGTGRVGSAAEEQPSDDVESEEERFMAEMTKWQDTLDAIFR
jgi:hypothetical protein